MLISFFESFYSGSHKAWIEGYKKHSKHHIEIFSLKGKNWKWRMHGGAITLARHINKKTAVPDLLVLSDMLDVCTFKALLPKKWQNIPIILYFHENQLSYPWNVDDKDLNYERERHYAFINYTSALAADRCLFNSNYHKDSFLNALKDFLKVYPDHRNMDTIEEIKEKSEVLYLGLDLKSFDAYSGKNTSNKAPVFLWNHRWDHDKNYTSFIKVFDQINNMGLEFQLIIAGEVYKNGKVAFGAFRDKMADKIIHFGYAETFEKYAELLWRADYLPVTSIQDFFGVSIAEAMYCETIPILPERLSYKELFDHGSLYYNTEIELRDILIDLIKDWPGIKKMPEQKFLKTLDWRMIVSTYDQCFKKLVININ